MNPYQENSFFFVGVICPCGRLKVNSNTQSNYGNRRGVKSIAGSDDGAIQAMSPGTTYPEECSATPPGNSTIRQESVEPRGSPQRLDLVLEGSRLNLLFR